MCRRSTPSPIASPPRRASARVSDSLSRPARSRSAVPPFALGAILIAPADALGLPEGVRAFLADLGSHLSPSAAPPVAFVGLLGLLLLWAAWRLARRLRARRAADPVAWSPARRRRAARRAARRGDFLEAGRLFADGGDAPAAAAAFEQGRAFLEAGRLWEAENQPARAARAYEQGGDLARAAELARRLGQYARAAGLYERDGQVVRAAEAAAKAGEPARAAALYAKCEAFDLAGDLRFQLGQFLEAAGLLERALARARPAVGAAPGAEAAGLVRRCAEAYVKAGRPAKAGAVLKAHGLEIDAAEQFCAAGDWETGLGLLFAHRQFSRAAVLCRTLGREEELPRIEGERHQAEGREAEAAAAFEGAGIWWRAADLYQRVGAYARAAEMATRQGDPERAAEMHAAAGNFRAAAEALEGLGRPLEAARYYAEAGAVREAARMLQAGGDCLGAGKILLQAEAVDEAMGLLQQVGPDSGQYLEATLLLGDLFWSRELLGPAREKYERAASLKPIAPDFLHPTYRLALLRERQGDAAEAIRLYEKILAERFDYQDVRARLLALRAAPTVPATLQAAGPDVTVRITAPPARPRYRLLRELGRGGMGVVYLAEDEVLRRRVAYKVLSGSLQADAAAVEMFLREARIAAALHHPNIVTVYDAGQSGDQVYIAMELLEGQSVEERLLAAGGPLPVPTAVDIVRQACLSLDHAHRQHVVHRDVKPANMMMTPAGVVKLMDFGLAAVVSRAAGKVSSVRGTPFYMAPEQIRGEAASPAADQYALGCTLYHMIAGRPPFMEGDVLYHHIHTEPLSPRQRNPELPLWLDAITLRTMQKAPDARFPSITALHAAVEECLSSVRTGPFLAPPPR
jgi:eukaryotic-like serine/threonine-protein kinase